MTAKIIKICSKSSIAALILFVLGRSRHNDQPAEEWNQDDWGGYGDLYG
jgi:hypothetical protein